MLAAILTLCGTMNVWADATLCTEADLRTAVGSSQAVTLGADIQPGGERQVISGQTVTHSFRERHTGAVSWQTA